MSCHSHSTRRRQQISPFRGGGAAAANAAKWTLFALASTLLITASAHAFPDTQEETVSVDESIVGGKVVEKRNATNPPSPPPAATMKALRDMPAPTFAFQRQFGYGNSPYAAYGGGGGFAPGGGGGLANFAQSGGGDNNNVNFDFQCKCTARSNLAKNMQPTSTDANQAAQQQIQQLQDQIRRLQEQIQRSSSGKSSFEQFAQMLAQADGLECNCSGASAAAGNFPSSPTAANNNFNNANHNANNVRGGMGMGMGPGGGMYPYGQGAGGGGYGNGGMYGGGSPYGPMMPGGGPYSNPSAAAGGGQFYPFGIPQSAAAALYGGTSMRGGPMAAKVA